MMQSSTIHHTISEFLQQMGFATVNWQGENLALAFEQLGMLNIEMTEQGLLLVLFKEINEFDINDLIPKALRLVHLDHSLPLTVQTGIKGNTQLAFITTLTTHQITIAGLTEAVSVLDHLHQQLTT